jgi:putative ABC transport system ATP-binding protein
MSLLRVENLSHSFDYQLFSNINFALEGNESISVVGVSGSGKSTLLHICATLLKPDNGIVSIFDKNLYEQKNQDILQIRREHVGIIFQTHYLFKGFNAYENIELATILNNTKLDEKLLEQLGIQNLMNHKIGELSGGQQQRVSIARVLSKKPKIIFADEPTGNLDGKTANEVMTVLFDYVKNNNAALMLVTHDDNLAKKCSKTIHLNMDSLEVI